MRLILASCLLLTAGAGDAPPRLTLVTWNVLHEEATWAERLPRLTAALDAAQPDVVCVQECSAPMRDALAAGAWARGLHATTIADDATPVRGLHVWSRAPQRAHAVRLPTRMGRAGLLAGIDAAGDPLAIGVVHLDSRLEDRPMRERQLAVMQRVLAPHAQALLVGDVNYGDGEADGAGLDPAWRDAWPLLRGADSGYTWDLTRNPRAPANSFPGEPSRRLDRVFARGAWVPVEVALIGTEPPTGSDHFGLRVVLEKR